MPPSGGLCLCTAEFAADGVLCAGTDRARCTRARRGGAADRCCHQRLGLHVGRRGAAAGVPVDHWVFSGVGGEGDGGTSYWCRGPLPPSPSREGRGSLLSWRIRCVGSQRVAASSTCAAGGG